MDIFSQLHRLLFLSPCLSVLVIGTACTYQGQPGPAAVQAPAGNAVPGARSAAPGNVSPAARSAARAFGDSPLGEWRGFVNCRNGPLAAGLIIKHDPSDGVEATFQLDDDARDKHHMTKYWGGYQRFTMTLSFENPEVRMAPKNNDDRRKRPPAMALQLELNGDGTLSGSTDLPACPSVRFERWSSARFAQAYVQRRAAQGMPLDPNERMEPLVSAGGFVARWRPINDCSPPSATLQISATDRRLMTGEVSARNDFFVRLRAAVTLQCPSANSINVVAEGRASALWPIADVSQWAFGAPQVASSSGPAPTANQRGPTGMRPLGALDPNRLREDARSEFVDAAARYQVAINPVLASFGSVRGSDISPRLLAMAAWRICEKKLAGMSDATAGEACYFAGMAMSNMFDTKDGWGVSSVSHSSHSPARPFARCAELSRMRDCALLAEYLGVISESPEIVNEARRALPTATVTGESPASVVKRITPTLISAKRAFDKQEHQACKDAASAKFEATGIPSSPRVKVCLDRDPKFEGCVYTSRGSTCGYACVNVTTMTPRQYCTENACGGKSELISQRYCRVDFWSGLFNVWDNYTQRTILPKP